MMNKYELYWKDKHIGSLTETNREMRSAGYILLNFLTESPEDRHIANCIENSIKAGIYLDEGDDENFRKMCEEETKFLDIINSPDWYIINDRSETKKILCPLFHENNEITWQVVT